VAYETNFNRNLFFARFILFFQARFIGFSEKPEMAEAAATMIFESG